MNSFFASGICSKIDVYGDAVIVMQFAIHGKLLGRALIPNFQESRRVLAKSSRVSFTSPRSGEVGRGSGRVGKQQISLPGRSRVRPSRKREGILKQSIKPIPSEPNETVPPLGLCRRELKLVNQILATRDSTALRKSVCLNASDQKTSSNFVGSDYKDTLWHAFKLG